MTPKPRESLRRPKRGTHSAPRLLPPPANAAIARATTPKGRSCGARKADRSDQHSTALAQPNANALGLGRQILVQQPHSHAIAAEVRFAERLSRPMCVDRPIEGQSGEGEGEG